MTSIYIDDVESITFITEAHQGGQGGILSLRATTRAPLTGQVEVTQVNFQVWRSEAWDRLVEIERAVMTAQEAGVPTPPDEVDAA